MCNRVVSFFLETKLSDKIIPMNSKPVMGVAWLEERIYVVTKSSNIVYVHPDQESIDGSNNEIIELKGMKKPWDMVASELSRTIFISDHGIGCVWRIQLPRVRISRWEVEGTPYEMFVSSLDVLVVCSIVDVHNYLNLYRSSDVMLIQSVPLPTEVGWSSHAVQLINENFIIAYSIRDRPDLFMISELSSSGMTFIRSFDPRRIEANRLDDWTPFHLSIDEDQNVFIADRHNDRVVRLNSRLTGFQILLNRDQHSIELPRRLCYVREKKQLIVGQEKRPGGLTHDVRLYNLHPHKQSIDPRTVKSELELIKSGSLDSVDTNKEVSDRFNPLIHIPGE